MKNSKRKIIVSILVVVALAVAFYIGGNGVGLHGWGVLGKALSAEASKAHENAYMDNTPINTTATETPQELSSVPPTTMEMNPETGMDEHLTAPVPSGLPVPVEPENVSVGKETYTCTLSVSCATILSNMDMLDEDKLELVPEDGWILKPMTVTFYEGESVFNVLQRTLKQQGIHLEFVDTPVYNSVYIEGIGNLYEFDVGELSGWLYRVNGWVPNYGCSRYQLQNGDVIEWVYTCDLGYDVGSGGTTGGFQNAES
ncbi:MAG: DUF4430 domain-containing protein [Oscillospiraceae bacterium]|nr:DUF4430 domain-containing protein [Oscillospiraceae bacterium]